MAVTADKEKTFAFSISNAVVSTIGIPEDPIVIDSFREKTMRNLNPRAVLISVKNESRKLALAMYFKGSSDKEGYRQLVPYFHDAETLTLYDADVFLSYPGNSRDAVRDSATALDIISHIPDLDFESAAYGYGPETTVITAHTHVGGKLPEGAPIYKISIALKKAAEPPKLERRA
ncbi:MAG: hypothetical protein KGH57_01525 [Candidatus Micrarchaeota archaeon]|nr:hypothetical protein [Candidatus Micrarchaeota archaeon]